MPIVTALLASICLATAEPTTPDAPAPCIDRQVFVNRTWEGLEGVQDCDQIAFYKRAAAISNGLGPYAEYWCETDPHGGEDWPVGKDRRPVDVTLPPCTACSS